MKRFWIGIVFIAAALAVPIVMFTTDNKITGMASCSLPTNYPRSAQYYICSGTTPVYYTITDGGVVVTGESGQTSRITYEEWYGFMDTATEIPASSTVPTPSISTTETESGSQTQPQPSAPATPKPTATANQPPESLTNPPDADYFVDDVYERIYFKEDGGSISYWDGTGWKPSIYANRDDFIRYLNSNGLKLMAYSPYNLNYELEASPEEKTPGIPAYDDTLFDGATIVDSQTAGDEELGVDDRFAIANRIGWPIAQQETNKLQQQNAERLGLACNGDTCKSTDSKDNAEYFLLKDGTVLKVNTEGDGYSLAVQDYSGKKFETIGNYKVEQKNGLLFFTNTKRNTGKKSDSPDNYVVIEGELHKGNSVRTEDGTVISEIMMDDDKYHTVKTTADGKSQVVGISGEYVDYKTFLRYQKFGKLMQDWQSDIAAGQYISILFGTQNSAWRKTWDEFFIHNVLGSVISGRWEESLCHHWIEKAPGGALYITIPDGTNLVGIGAFVAAERTELYFENASGPQREYYYKINMYAKNPEKASRVGQAYEQDMDFNVQLIGQKTVSLFTTNQHVGPGESFIRTGTKVIVKESKTRYDTICMKFTSSIFTANGEDVSEVCNSIATYAGGATRMQIITEDGKTAGGSGEETNPI
ncbi:MAG: hypothetical protein ABIF10_03455 [Candidatus Woesearchaeota archaeon]